MNASTATLRHPYCLLFHNHPTLQSLYVILQRHSRIILDCFFKEWYNSKQSINNLRKQVKLFILTYFIDYLLKKEHTDDLNFSFCFNTNQCFSDVLFTNNSNYTTLTASNPQIRSSQPHEPSKIWRNNCDGNLGLKLSKRFQSRNSPLFFIDQFWLLQFATL